MAVTTDVQINPLRELCEQYRAIEKGIRLGGGPKAIDRQHEKGRLTARERIDRLLDAPASTNAGGGGGFFEIGLWSAWSMYTEHGGAPAAGVVTGVGRVHGRECMIIANDATVKAGAFFPMTCKKIIRAQTVAMMARLPLIYLVDSAGVFLPLQEDVFPDTDDFGRIFRNNAVISAMGVPQVAAIMGYCVAGGGYLPVLCDTLLMTEGSGLYLAGPALVKAAIGQSVTDEELGGASMHAAISGTIDFKEKDDEACIERLRSLMAKYPASDADHRNAMGVARLQAWTWRDPHQTWGGFFDEAARRLAVAKSDDEKQQAAQEVLQRYVEEKVNFPIELIEDRMNMRDPQILKSLWESLGGTTKDPSPSRDSARPTSDVYKVFTDKPGTQYDVRDLIACFVDAKLDDRTGAPPTPVPQQNTKPDFDEYKAEYGQSIVCGYAKIGGHAVGIVANQKKLVQRSMPGGALGGGSGPSKSVQMPGVIYDDSADKSARFIMDCNQRKIPIVFIHDTTGFMVGRDSEHGGIIRAGAKMVNAMANCVVPKIVLITGGSYGAGNYAMCGRAFDPFISMAWPSAKCAVMGANQATGVLTTIEEASRKRKGEEIDEAAHKQIYSAIHASYTEQADIRHGAARGWLDRIIQPEHTRDELIAALEAAEGWDYSREFKTGVLQT